MTDKPELSVTIIIVIINHIATQGLSVQIQEFDAFLFHCHGLRPGGPAGMIYVRAGLLFSAG